MLLGLLFLVNFDIDAFFLLQLLIADLLIAWAERQRRYLTFERAPHSIHSIEQLVGRRLEILAPHRLDRAQNPHGTAFYPTALTASALTAALVVRLLNTAGLGLRRLLRLHAGAGTCHIDCCIRSGASLRCMRWILGNISS